ncbi:MAG: hypothetical protein RL685_7772 [Pseudomonadota bacterium]
MPQAASSAASQLPASATSTVLKSQLQWYLPEGVTAPASQRGVQADTPTQAQP